MARARMAMGMLALLGFCQEAKSAVLTTYSLEALSVGVGATITQSLLLNLTPDVGPNDTGYFNPLFSGGTITLFAGNGASASFSINPGSTSQLFTYSFSYSSPGTYTPSYSFDATYTEQYSRWENSPGLVIDYGWVTHTDCHGPWGCQTWTIWEPIGSHWVDNFRNVTYTDTKAQSGSESGPLLTVEPPMATPLPAALPLFATGLGALGVFEWRRKRRRQPLHAANGVTAS